MESTVMQYDVARAALAEARTLDEVKGISDKVDAMRHYARQAKDPDMEIWLAEIRVRALRQLGELTRELELLPGGRPSRNLSDVGQVSKNSALTAAGISRQDAHRAERIADLDESKFESLIEQRREQRKPITVDEIVRVVGRDANRAERIAGIVKSAGPLDSLGPFPLLYADPPWEYDYAQSDSRRVDNQYPTMSLEAIEALKVPACDDAVLFLWATSPKLEEALQVLRAWGFGYRTCMVWDKQTIGMGYYARQRHELLLIGARGSLPVPKPENRPPSVLAAPRGKHSEKPVVFYEAIEAMYPELRGRMVELFQRKPRDTWEAWGFEA